MSRIGVLLMTFGAVESLEDLPQYYANIRGGRPPTPQQLADLQARYERIGGRSPLVHITRRQATSLQRRLAETGLDVPVAMGMRFWTPSIQDGVRRLADQGVRRIVGITSGPYDSRISIGSYERHLAQAATTVDPSLEVDLVRRWHDAPGLDDAWAARHQEALDQVGWEADSYHALLSAHALPERVLVWNDPYPQQFVQHATRLAQRLGLRAWGVTYQSAGLTEEPWLGPDILAALDYVKAMGVRRVLSMPIGFCADHLEILNDLDHEASAKAAALGLEFQRVPSLNDSAAFIRTLAAIVASRVAEATSRMSA